MELEGTGCEECEDDGAWRQRSGTTGGDVPWEAVPRWLQWRREFPIETERREVVDGRGVVG